MNSKSDGTKCYYRCKKLKNHIAITAIRFKQVRPPPQAKQVQSIVHQIILIFGSFFFIKNYIQY